MVFDALTLKLPIQTSLSMVHELPVSLSSHEKCEHFSKTSTPQFQGQQHFQTQIRRTIQFPNMTNYTEQLLAFYFCKSRICHSKGTRLHDVRPLCNSIQGNWVRGAIKLRHLRLVKAIHPIDLFYKKE